MSKLPKINGNAALKAFERAGFQLVRTTGSHHILKREGHQFLLSLPIHGSKDVGSGLLRKLIRAAGLTVEEFCDLLG
jgi:predicted RNA binding protein YcfA (HicA-like mRNA interferase family)